MKKPFALICGTIALLCLLSMFIPIVAPCYPAALYRPTADYAQTYFLSGDMYYAREYWSIVRFMLAVPGIVPRVALSVSMSLLLYWTTLSFMGDRAVRAGLLASVVNLGVTAFFVIRMLAVMASCRWGVLAIMALDTLAAVAVAVIHCFGE